MKDGFGILGLMVAVAVIAIVIGGVYLIMSQAAAVENSKAQQLQAQAQIANANVERERVIQDNKTERWEAFVLGIKSTASESHTELTLLVGALVVLAVLEVVKYRSRPQEVKREPQRD